MPINAFGGGPGSGKTYGVMEHVILPAVAAGRFILTNIDGLSHDAIYQYVVSKAPKGKIICVGHIRSCSRDAPEKPDFFPGIDKLDHPDSVPSPDRQTVCGGDLVVIDEATRYWSVGEKVSKEAQFFFREHRHFSNECGDTCDLVVIDPDLTQLARALKGKIELASVTRKLKEVGLSRYMVDLYPRARVTGKAQQSRGPYAFQAEIYTLYKSYSHEKAKEQVVDKRQNMLGGLFFKVVMPLSVLVIIGGVWGAKYWLTNRGAKPETVAQKEGGAVSSPAAVAAPVPRSNEPQISDKWRAVGYVVAGSEVAFYLDDGHQRRTFANPVTYKLGRRSYDVKVGEEWVTEYSGSSSGRSGSLLR